MTANATPTPDDSYALLHPHLQEHLYKLRWRDLRPIQKAAIQQVVKGTGHVILSAPTAGGKTEAAFLPILSQVLDDAENGVRAVYIGPLKALINDQFRRLDELCKEADFPVHKWHGDVSPAAKKELRDRPSGVLLITPESLESLFINHADRLEAMFSRLAFVIIDELHAFMGSERGAHLRSLLCRLVRRSKLRVRLLGLSATFGPDGKQVVERWLQLQPTDTVQWLEAPSSGKKFSYQIKGYWRAASEGKQAQPLGESTTESSESQRLGEDLLQYLRGKTALIFGNRKAELEVYADLLSGECKRLGLPECIRVHHGSLSKAEREESEAALRSEIPTATFCSSTLEMGIDVGKVKVVGQIGPPWSVNSLTQRLGRSGRGEEDSADLRMFIEEDEPTPRQTLLDRLHPRLLQAAAMTELLLARWCEPPDGRRLHLSTLVQQILSVTAEHGGAKAESLFEALIEHGGFCEIDQPLFIEVLRNMGAADLLEQTGQGELILGIQGERIVRSKDFYAVFQSAEDYSVLHDGHTIGTVTYYPGSEIDSYLILAGRRWKIVLVEPDRKVILVKPAQGGKPPSFAGTASADIHPLVREEMRRMLFAEAMPVYLDTRAQEILSQARRAAKEVRLNERSLIVDGQQVIWLTWTGTRINRTLLTYARHVANLNVQDEDIALVFEASPEKVLSTFKAFASNPPTAEKLASLVPHKIQEKYDPFLSDSLQGRVYARNSLDVEGAAKLTANRF